MTQHARFRIVGSHARHSICGLIVAMLFAAPALGLPADDYAEAFQACAGQPPKERAHCCTSAANDCAGECQRLTDSQRGTTEMSPAALEEYLLACQAECAASESECTTPSE